MVARYHTSTQGLRSTGELSAVAIRAQLQVGANDVSCEKPEGLETDSFLYLGVLRQVLRILQLYDLILEGFDSILHVTDELHYAIFVAARMRAL